MINGCIVLTLKDVDIDATIKKVEQLLKEEKNLSPALRSMIEMLILVVALLVNRWGLSSSKPPSIDQNRKRASKKKAGRKAGGQRGHIGVTLKKFDDPDEIKILMADRRRLPRGSQYRDCGFESRQVIDFELKFRGSKSSGL